MPRATARPEALVLPPLTSLPPMSRLLVQVGLLIARWDNRHRTRCALARLDDHLLRDTGLHPLIRDAECQKPFWRE